MLAETRIGVKLPNEIRQFYLDGFLSNETFWKTIERINFNENFQLVIQIDDIFAKEIIKTLLNLSSNEKKELIAEETQGNVVPNFEILVNSYLTEYVNKYNPETNQFQRKYIQKSYKKLGNNSSHLKIVLCLWAHCGGWGGIIIKGKNAGFNGGGMHGHYKTVTVDSKEYEYNSNFYENMEKSHIASLRKDIELANKRNGS